MRTIGATTAPKDPLAAQRWLRERIAEVERTCPGADGRSVVPTGWGSIDAALPHAGLALGATHEWLGVSAGAGSVAAGRDGPWTPPVFILAHLARAAAGEGWTVWIGRRVWPYPHALVRTAGAGALERALLIDPPDEATRLWAIDQSLRCPRMVVVADGSGLRFTPSRRLQLAAEAGRSLALLARPWCERTERSAAGTRWEVSRVAARAGSVRWSVRLARCRGAAPTRLGEWTLERGRGGGVVVVAADVRDGRGASARAS